MNSKQPYRLIISGGGTGGHIFPAVAIANAFKDRYPDAQILFVGAKGRMEMTRVPEAGYEIIGLWISGLKRSLSFSNVLFPLKLAVSYFKAIRIIKQFKPSVVVGTGGFASGPMVMAANYFRIPTLIQEQNSFAGLVNKMAASKVKKICVAYEGMEKYFPAEKIVLTGNPVRKKILEAVHLRDEALKHFGLKDNEKTLLIIGGSLGAKTINESILKDCNKLVDAQIRVLWQTGKLYNESCIKALKNIDLSRWTIAPFIHEMELAYAAADLVISRSGALAVSEICVAKKPCILVPSPNVAEDHQTKNAKALSDRDAAILVPDKEAKERLVDEALKLLQDSNRAERLAGNIAKLARPQATEDIVNEVENLIDIKA